MNGGLDRLHPVITHHLANSLGWQSLRALQKGAVAPVLDGSDALLLAPTAGGKTEAAIFPLLTAMESARWAGLSVIFVCPLKAQPAAAAGAVRRLAWPQRRDLARRRHRRGAAADSPRAA
jgi:Lhr-like helicase